MKKIFPHLEYSIIPLRQQSHTLPEPVEQLKCEAYRAWREVWADVFKDLNVPVDLSADEFLRHDLCCVLHQKEKVAGVHLYSIFHLDRPIEPLRRYLSRSYTSAGIDVLNARGHRRLLSFEYLTVMPEFRGQNFGYSLPVLLCALGLDVFNSHPDLDCAIGVTRNSRKVNGAALQAGVEQIETGVLIHGEPSDVFLFDQPKRPTQVDEAYEEFLQLLWVQRQDHRTHLNQDNEQNNGQKGVLHVA